jgi:hypothetical protein
MSDCSGNLSVHHVLQGHTLRLVSARAAQSIKLQKMIRPAAIFANLGLKQMLRKRIATVVPMARIQALESARNARPPTLSWAVVLAVVRASAQRERHV